MKIATKFDIGQKVFIVDEWEHCIYYKKIELMRMLIGEGDLKIYYEIAGISNEVDDNSVFLTIEEAGQKLKELEEQNE